jgi:hypothetical protein
MTDYQGRTYISPPLGEAPHLQSEPGSQESFIPKVCIHTWTGHTAGVSVIRLFPETGHLLLSGSMDTKIKVIVGLFDSQSPLMLSRLALGRLYAYELPTYLPWSREGSERRNLL